MKTVGSSPGGGGMGFTPEDLLNGTEVLLCPAMLSPRCWDDPFSGPNQIVCILSIQQQSSQHWRKLIVPVIIAHLVDKYKTTFQKYQAPVCEIREGQEGVNPSKSIRDPCKVVISRDP